MIITLDRLTFICFLPIANLYYKGRCLSVCLSVCGHSNVRLTTPPVLMLWGTQGYLWLPYDLTEVIKLIGETFEPKQFIFSKRYFMSFLPNYCHSFRIAVIPSVLLSFLPDYCHSFRIIVIPSRLLSFLPNIVISSELFRELKILTSSKTYPYPKGEKNGHRRWPYMRVLINILASAMKNYIL